MPRTKRHVASSVSTNPNEDSGPSSVPCTTSSIPPMAAEEHVAAPVQPEQTETTERSLPRGNKRNARTWDVQIKGELYISFINYFHIMISFHGFML